MTPDQITASRDRLVSEGFHPSSKALFLKERKSSLCSRCEQKARLMDFSMTDPAASLDSCSRAERRSGFHRMSMITFGKAYTLATISLWKEMAPKTNMVERWSPSPWVSKADR